MFLTSVPTKANDNRSLLLHTDILGNSAPGRFWKLFKLIHYRYHSDSSSSLRQKDVVKRSKFIKVSGGVG